jgi:hypothetical protein
MKSVIVSIGNALQVLEHFTGEVFDRGSYSVVDINLDEFQRKSVDIQNYKKLICALTFCGGKYPDLDLSKFDVVVVFDEEAINDNSQDYLSMLRTKFDNQNIVIVCSGYHKDFKPDPDTVYVYPYFLQSILKYNQLTQVDSITNYQKTFDVLLGGVKRHRKFIFNQLGQHAMLDACYVNLTLLEPKATIYRSPELYQLEETNGDQGFDSYVELESGVRTSHIVPWDIYQNSLYSLISETNFENYFFFSEKTAKALYAQRPFVFFGAQGQLADLKRLGFRTFDTVFNEAYDSIADPTERFTQAFEQVKWLFAQNHPRLYQRLQPILEHNCAHIQNRKHFLEPLKQWLYQHC